MPKLAYVSLGSNLGDRLGHLQAALDALQYPDSVWFTQLSRVYESPPAGYESEADYLNAVAEVRTFRDPYALLSLMQQVEADLGRERNGKGYADRTIDLDLLWYDGRELSESVLQLPHPRAKQRPFILRPWRDVAAETVDLEGKSLDAWIEELPNPELKTTRLRKDLKLKLPAD